MGTKRTDMPRTSQGPRYYDSKKAWYANIGGERILLIRGPRKETRERAQEQYQLQMAARRVEVEGDRNTLWAVLNAYVVHLENRVANKEVAIGTLRIHRPVIEDFNQAHG